MRYAAEGVASYDAEVTGNPYAAGGWQAEHQVGQHQHPFSPGAAAAYGSYRSQQQHGPPTHWSQGPMHAGRPSANSTHRQGGPVNSLHAAVRCDVAPTAIRQQQYHTMPATPAYQCPEDDSLKSIRDLPVAFQPLFNFRYFNAVQSECFDVAFKQDTNLVISAPTGAGKTGVLELAMLRLLSKHLTTEQSLQPLQGGHKIVYIGPIKALVQERHNDWQARYGSQLGLRCVQLTGDVDDDQLDDDLETADIICSTPEKFDQVTRKVKEHGKMAFFAQLGLILLDEVHLLNEAGRGSSLEAGCVGRIKAVATIPEMSKAHIASVRFVAVSATIPNIIDLATWLNVPPTGIKQYGDELRPCKLTTHVKGYNPAKNDFLFERRLTDHVYGIVTGYCNGRPALVFCNSRKGTMDTAAILAKEAATQSSCSTSSVFVKSIQQLQRLQAAASQAKAKGLAAVLVAGVGFHNAAMEPEDRELVERVFKANDLPVLCTTSTLAMGVNLPAHLVVVKGTKRYVGESETAPGETTGYKEYTQTEVLQMVGRAGRPQFDNEGVAVIMTSKDSTHSYQRMMTGQPVESCLMANLAEHLNAELVLGTIQDVPGAIQWIKSSFLYTRVRSNPSHYGLGHKMKPGMSQAELDAVLKSQLIMQSVSQLLEYGLASTDEDSYSLASTKAGRLMANHFLKLRTMAAIVKLGQQPNMPSLLRVICGAAEFKSASLRRCERKVLNDINHATDPQQLRYHVMATHSDGTATGKVKERLTTPQEKLFVLLNDALADKPSELLDYSLKQEQERLLLVGQRIAKCMARYYIERNSFSAAGRSLLLARSLRAKLWDDSQVSVRQIHGVGKLLASRLSAAGLGNFKALMACDDAHQIEVAAQKPYPWGSELLSNLRSIIPPAVRMQLQVLKTLPNRAVSCAFTLTRLDTAQAAAAAATAAAVAGGNAAGKQAASSNWAKPLTDAAATAESAATESSARINRAYETHTPCKLLCGCSNTDQLLLMRNVVLETFESPMQLTFLVEPPSDPKQPLNISARLVLDRIVGLDEKTSMSIPPAGRYRQSQQLGTGPGSDDMVAAAVEEAEPEDEYGSAGTPAQAAHRRSAAQPSVSRKQRAKRPASSLAEERQGDQEDAAVPSRAKQPCKLSRQRGTNVTEPLQNDRLGQQQLARQWMGPASGNNFSVLGAHLPATNPDPDVTRNLQQGTSVSLETASAQRLVPQTAIAARYSSLFAPKTAADVLKQQATGAASSTVSEVPEDIHPGGAAPEVAAVDAEGIEFTPEHQRQLQQLTSQQSPTMAQHVSQQEPLDLARQHQGEATVMVGSTCGASQPPHMTASRQDTSRQQPEPTDVRPASPCFDLGGGGFSIAAMFDMLADNENEGCNTPEKQQQQQASNTLDRTALVCPAPGTTAPRAPKVAAAAAAASTHSSWDRHTTPAAAAAAAAPNSVFETAVLRSIARSSSVQLSTPGTTAATLTQGTISSTLLQHTRMGMRSKPVGLGDPRLGAAAILASSSTPTAAASHAQVLGPQHTHVHQQQVLEQRQRPMRQRQLDASVSSSHTHEQMTAIPVAALSAIPGQGASRAADAQQADPANMFTPPRQIIRSDHSAGLLHSAALAEPVSGIRPGRQPQQQQGHWTQQRAADVLQLEQDCTEEGDVTDWRDPAAPPNLQQFAFAGSGASQAPLPAAYRPSQNALMFQRSQQVSSGPAAGNRALAQAKLAAKGSSRTSGSSSFSLQCQQQLRGYRTASMALRPASSYMGSISSNQPRDIQQQQRCLPAASMQPPAAPKVQWNGFVDETHQQGRLQAARHARTTWRAPTYRPTAQHLVIRSPTFVVPGAGLGSVVHQLQHDAAGLARSWYNGPTSLTADCPDQTAAHQSGAGIHVANSRALPHPHVQQNAATTAATCQAGSTGMAAADGSVYGSSTEVAERAGDAEQAPDSEDGGCVDFGGIFDFMKC